MSDPVHHPAHYGADRFGIECIAITRYMSFNIGNAFKYVWRHLDKGAPRQDLEKSLVYIGWAMEDRTPAYVDLRATEIAVSLFSQSVLPALVNKEQPEVFWALASLVFNRPGSARDHILEALEALS